MTILGWFVLQSTDSAWLVVLVGFSASVPLLILGLIGGYLADATNRKWVMFGSQFAVLLSSASMSFLLGTQLAEYWHSYVCAIIVGISWALEMPSRRSSMHDLLGSSGVTNGVALDAMGMSASRMAGPALAGLLISMIGLTGAYVTVTIFISMASMLLLKFNLDPQSNTRVAHKYIMRNLIAGIKYVASERSLSIVILITVVMNMLMYPYMHLVPVIARDTLHAGPVLMGMLMAGEGTGAMLGSIIIASANNIKFPNRLFIGGSLFSFVLLLAFSLSNWYVISFTALILLGLGASGFSTMQGSIVMLASRKDMRGKVLGVVSLAIGASPLGALLEGAIADRQGPELALGINAVLGIILVCCVAILILPMAKHKKGTESL